MKDRKNTVPLLLASILVILTVILASGGSGQEPMHVRIKNRLNGAHHDNDDADILASRIYLTKNTASADFPLQIGECGWQVELVQRMMNRHCRAHLTEDGVWGNATERAIHSYYVNAKRYDVPIWNKFFAYVGTNYRIDQFRFSEMIEQFGPSLV